MVVMLNQESVEEVFEKVSEQSSALFFASVYFLEAEELGVAYKEILAKLRASLIPQLEDLELQHRFIQRGDRALIQLLLRRGVESIQLFRMLLQRYNVSRSEFLQTFEEGYSALFTQTDESISDWLTSPDCGAEFIRFAWGGVSKHRDVLAIASNPNCPADIQEQLTGHGSFAVRQSLALNPSLTDVLMENLSKDWEQGVRVAIASNPNCSARILKSLSHDESINVRIATLLNPNCPESLLELAMAESSRLLDVAILQHRACPRNFIDEVFPRLSDEEKAKALRNPNLPQSYVEQGVYSRNEHFQLSALIHQSMSSQLLQSCWELDLSESQRHAIIQNPNCPPQILAKIEQSGPMSAYATSLFSRNDFQSRLSPNESLRWLKHAYECAPDVFQVCFRFLQEQVLKIQQEME